MKYFVKRLRKHTKYTRVKITFANYTEVKTQFLGDLRYISVECKALSYFQPLENHTKTTKKPKSSRAVV